MCACMRICPSIHPYGHADTVRTYIHTYMDTHTSTNTHPSVYVQAGELAAIAALIFKSSALPKIQMYVCITFIYLYTHTHTQSLPLTVTAALIFKSFAKADGAWTSSNCTGMVVDRRRRFVAPCCYGAGLAPQVKLVSGTLCLYVYTCFFCGTLCLYVYMCLFTCVSSDRVTTPSALKTGWQMGSVLPYLHVYMYSCICVCMHSSTSWGPGVESKHSRLL